VTPLRTIAVAVLTIVTVVASPFAAGAITGLLAGNKRRSATHWGISYRPCLPSQSLSAFADFGEAGPRPLQTYSRP
jgi:hypothetical protein